MKWHFTLVATVLLSVCSASAKTFDWRITGNDTQAAQFAAYHGETVRFNLIFSGAASNLTAQAIYYQTNGMGRTYFPPIPGTVFHPTNDCGAAVYRFFIRCTDPDGINYSANGLLRLLDSPGFEPSVVELPVKTLDFDLIDVLHAPWATPDDLAAAADELHGAVDTKADATKDVVTTRWRFDATGLILEPDADDIWAADDANYMQYVADRGVYRWTIAGYGEGLCYGGADTAALTNATGTAYTFTRLSATNQYDVAYQDDVAAAISTLSDSIPTTTSNIVTKAYVENLGISSKESDPTVPSWAKTETKPIYTASEVGAVPTSRTVNGKALSANISLTASDVGAATTSALQTLSSQVSAISGHLNAEDARFVSTNYNSQVHLPEASVEVSVSNEWLTVWREMTRWDAFVGSGFDWASWGGFLSWMSMTEAALDQKADRAWGYYDSHTGEWAPEGYTQVSSSNILIAAGMGFQRTVSSGHTYWVLTANEPYEVSGISSNGFFRVADADGNVQFEIIKGDKRTVPAPPDGVSASGGVLTVSYPVASQPKVEVSLTLADGGTWYAEDSASCPATVAWSGTSGAYVATVTPSAPTAQLFVKASYQVGGETFINNRAPISITGGIYFQGTLYMPTVSGNELKFIAQ